MVAQDAPQRPTHIKREEFEPRAEDLFDVPLDKQSKNTADGEFSPAMTDEDGASGFKAGEIAAKALDLPISTSHSPQTAEKIPVAHMSAKPNNFTTHEQYRTASAPD